MTATELMRSRYSAFALTETDYLTYSWHPDTRPTRMDIGDDLQWRGLEVVATEGGGAFDATGTVEFIAYAHGLHDGAMRERSRFARHPDDNRWVYVDGTALDPNLSSS